MTDGAALLMSMIWTFRAGRLPVDRLVTTYPLEDINEAVADQQAGHCIKVVLTLD